MTDRFAVRCHDTIFGVEPGSAQRRIATIVG